MYLGESSSALLGSLDELSLLCDEIATATEPREVEVRFRAAGHRVTQQLAAVAKDSAQEAERSASAWLIIVAIPGHVILAMLVLKLVISLDFRWSSSQTKSS